MSHVTNLMVSWNIGGGSADFGASDEGVDGRRADEINRLLAGLCDGQELCCVDEPSRPSIECGGQKHLEANLMVAAVNYLDEQAFLSGLAAMGWEYPEDVQVFIRRQNEDRWSIIYPCLVDGGQG